VDEAGEFQLCWFRATTPTAMGWREEDGELPQPETVEVAGGAAIWCVTITAPTSSPAASVIAPDASITTGPASRPTRSPIVLFGRAPAETGGRMPGRVGGEQGADHGGG
jgi:hypothetical protein